MNIGELMTVITYTITIFTLGYNAGSYKSTKK